MSENLHKLPLSLPALEMVETLKALTVETRRLAQERTDAVAALADLAFLVDAEWPENEDLTVIVRAIHCAAGAKLFPDNHQTPPDVGPVTNPPPVTS